MVLIGEGAEDEGFLLRGFILLVHTMSFLKGNEADMGGRDHCPGPS